MVLSNIFKRRREVPEDLPDLAIEDIEDSEAFNKPILKKKKYLKELKNLKEEPEEAEVLNLKTDKGFFKNLLNNVQEEIQDIEELESWYENKFKPEDIVSQMKEYWEKQKPEVILQNFGSGLKKELDEKINKLHDLELDWQKVYIKLLEKEHEIKEEEESLKETLSEFVKLCKKHLSKKDVGGGLEKKQKRK